MAVDPLPPGVLPNITDTDPPPLNEATVIGDGFVGAIPVNIDAPMVTFDGTTLSCTTGNWHGEPTSYAYQWQLDGADIGDDAPVCDPAGAAGSATCLVTASNAYGTTAGPLSNAVAIGTPARQTEHEHERNDEPRHGRGRLFYRDHRDPQD